MVRKIRVLKSLFLTCLASSIRFVGSSCGPEPVPPNDPSHEDKVCTLEENTSIQLYEANNNSRWRVNASKICKPEHRYRAVIANENDFCLVKRLLRCQDFESYWIDFSTDLSIEPNMDTFLGLKVNFETNEFDKCLILRQNKAISIESPNAFYWDMEHCNTTAGRLCMKDFRRYWGQSGTNNNIFAQACIAYVSDGVNALQVDQSLRSYANRSLGRCDFENSDSSIEAQIFNISSCNEIISLERYSVFCPSNDNADRDEKLVIAEFSVSDEEMRNYLSQDTLPEGSQNRRSIILPPENTLLSINVISQRPVKKSTISFKSKFSYKKWFSENMDKLTFNSGERGYFRATYRYIKHEPLCVFIDEKSQKFNTTGCKCTAKGEIATCTSNHTTVFTVLLSVDSVQIPGAVKIISVVTLSVSVIFLFITFITLLWVRKSVRGERIPIQINLTFSMMMMHFWLLWGDIAFHHPIFCRVHAVLVHFFLISTALWMMNEASLLLLKTSDWMFFNTKRRKVVIASMLIGWVVPIVYVAIVAAMGFSYGLYMEENSFTNHGDDSNGFTGYNGSLQYEHCWLNSTNGMRWSAVGPVIVILLYNLAIVIRTTVFIYRKRSEAQNLKPVQQTDTSDVYTERLKNVYLSLKSTILLLPVLGIPWILMLFSRSSTDWLLYVNAIINGLQGLFVFFIYCIIDHKVKDASTKRLSSFADDWMTFSDSRDKRKKSYTPSTAETISK